MSSTTEKRKVWSWSRLHLGWLLFWYLCFFLVLFLGITKWGIRGGLPPGEAALIAIPAALIVWFLINVQDR